MFKLKIAGVLISLAGLALNFIAGSIEDRKMEIVVKEEVERQLEESNEKTKENEEEA